MRWNMCAKKLCKLAALLLAAAAVIANFIYTALKAGAVQRFYRYDTPAFYNEAFLEEGRYPDLFIRLLIRDKEVVLAREIRPYDSYPSFGRDEEDGNPFDSAYFRDNNYARYFREYAASVELDRSLPAGEEVKEALSSAMESFTDLGIANDMLRYSFPLNREKIQQARAFWYYWYYHSFAEENPDDPASFPRVFMATEGIEEAERLIALWDEYENLYVMSEALAVRQGILSGGAL